MSIVDASSGAFKDIFDHHILPKYIMLRWSHRLRWMTSILIDKTANLISHTIYYEIPDIAFNMWYNCYTKSYIYPELINKHDRLHIDFKQKEPSNPDRLTYLKGLTYRKIYCDIIPN